MSRGKTFNAMARVSPSWERREQQDRLKEMYYATDIDRDGRVSFEDFLAMRARQKTAETAVRGERAEARTNKADEQLLHPVAEGKMVQVAIEPSLNNETLRSTDADERLRRATHQVSRRRIITTTGS